MPNPSHPRRAARRGLVVAVLPFRLPAPAAPSSSILERQPIGRRRSYCAVSVPVIDGCTEQTNGYEPAFRAGTWYWRLATPGKISPLNTSAPDESLISTL